LPESNAGGRSAKDRCKVNNAMNKKNKGKNKNAHTKLQINTTNPVCERRVNLLVYSLSLHRHSYIDFILAFASSIHNKQTNLKINNNIRRLCGSFRTSRSHTHPSHSQTSVVRSERHDHTLTNRTRKPLVRSPITLPNLSFINLVSNFRCSSPPHNTVYPRCVDLSPSVFSLSSHRHSYVSLFFRSRFIVSK
jgi:hypothetical protein